MRVFILALGLWGLALLPAGRGVFEAAAEEAEKPYMTFHHPPSQPQPLLQHHSFASALLKTEVGYSIYLPPGYAEQTSRRYPVVYWLHGRGQNESCDQFPAAIVQEGIRQHILPPLIIVYPSGGQFSMYCDSADGRWPVESMLVRELIPHIDATWRTEAARESRAIQGMSMGGFGALRLALKYPRLFSSVAAFAAGLRTEEEMREAARAETFEKIFGGKGDYFAAQHPETLARQAASAPQPAPAVRLYCGLADGLLENNRRLHRILEEQKAAFDHVELPGIGHDLPALAAAVGTGALEFAASHFGSARAADRDGPWVNPPAEAVPGCEHHVFFSEKLQRPVGYNIFLPAAYAENPQQRFPVIYYLPGMTDSESTHLPIVAPLGHAIRAGQLPPMLWVSCYAGRRSWFAEAADGSVPGESVIIEELIPHIDARWRTLAVREARGIEGFSMGGNGALRLAAKHPGLFCSVVAVSGGFRDLAEMKEKHPHDLLRLWGTDAAWEADSVWSLLEKQADVFRGQKTAVRQAVGTGDFLLENNRRLKALFDRLKIPVEYDELPGLGHDPREVFARAGVQGWQFHSAQFARLAASQATSDE